jgi:hypothetical protein
MIDIWSLQLQYFPIEENKESLKIINRNPTSNKVKSKFKWQTVLDTPPVFDPTEIGMADISKIEWSPDNVKQITRSSSGSQGVFFVQSKQGTSVLKAPYASFHSEVTSSLLSVILGIKTPRLRIIETQSNEGIALLNTIKVVDRQWNFFPEKAFGQSHLLHRDYVYGFEFNDYEVTTLLLQNVLNDLILSKRFFNQLGNLIAFDIFCNNGDRLPVVWDNRGNLGNVYIQPFSNDSIDIINLDSNIRIIDIEKYPDEYEKYKKAVVTFLSSLKDNGIGKQKIEHCVRLLEKHVGDRQSDLNNAIEFTIEGIQTTVKKISALNITSLISSEFFESGAQTYLHSMQNIFKHFEYNM